MAHYCGHCYDLKYNHAVKLRRLKRNYLNGRCFKAPNKKKNNIHGRNKQQSRFGGVKTARVVFYQNCVWCVRFNLQLLCRSDSIISAVHIVMKVLSTSNQ